MPYVGSPLPSEFLEKTVDRRIYTGDAVETFFEVNFDGENVDVFIDGVKLVLLSNQFQEMSYQPCVVFHDNKTQLNRQPLYVQLK